MSADPTPLLSIATLLLTAAAAVYDLRTGLIPNRLVASAAAALLCARLLPPALSGGGGAALAALAQGALGAVATACVPLLLYRTGGIGGGDVKLLAVVGLALGPLAGLTVELYAFALLLLYAPARLLYQGTLLRTLAASTSLLVRPFVPAARRRPRPSAALTSFRFGPAIFLATAVFVVWHGALA